MPMPRPRRNGQAVLRQFPNGSVNVFDRELRYCYAEGLGLERVGLSAEALVGKRLRDLFPPDQVALTEPYYARAFAGEEVAFDLPLGDHVFEIRAAPFDRDAAGISHVVAVAQDVTVQRKAQADLAFLVRASAVLGASLDVRETLTTLAELCVPYLADWCVVHLAGDDGPAERVAVAHADPAKTELARELAESYPLEPDGPSGAARVLRTGQVEVHPVVRDENLVASAVNERHLALYRGLGLASAIIVPMVARGAVLGAISLALSPPRGPYSEADVALTEDLGRRAGVAADNAQLYERAQAEIARRERAEEAERLRHLALDRLAEANIVGIIGGVGERITTANDLFLRMLGYEREELLNGGLAWPELTPPEHAGADERALEQLRTTGAAPPFEKEYLASDGTRVPVLLGCAMLERAPFRWVCFVLDLRERRRQEAEHEAFLADVSHDLRNPIAAARAQVQLLRRRLRQGRLDAAGVDAALASIEASTGRMVERIEELMDVARLRAGHPVTLQREPVDLVALVGGVVATYRLTTDRHRIVLVATEPALTGRFDRRRLERVLDNLLSNAVKFSPDGGTVTVSVDRVAPTAGDWAVVRVSDEGIGIPEADLPALFERFHRGKTAAAQTAGTGIGLAGASRIVEQHGGDISVESAKGRGTAVTVRLPLSGS